MAVGLEVVCALWTRAVTAEDSLLAVLALVEIRSGFVNSTASVLIYHLTNFEKASYYKFPELS
jgi:hypothetical protein